MSLTRSTFLYGLGASVLLIPTFSFAQLNPSLDRKSINPALTEVWGPKPVMVTPATDAGAPSDAIILFDGTHLEAFKGKDGEEVGWRLEDGILTVVPGAGAIATKQAFGSCQLHLEFRTPAQVKGEGQNNGNSGVFLQSRYEIQILGSYDSETYVNGQCAAIYKQAAPLVNASLPKEEWQTYDILYTAPTFNADGVKTSPAQVTVLHNGILVHHNVEIKGTTEYRGLPQNIAHGKAPLRIQDHGEPVSFRNIWIREL